MLYSALGHYKKKVKQGPAAMPQLNHNLTAKPEHVKKMWKTKELNCSDRAGQQEVRDGLTRRRLAKNN